MFTLIIKMFVLDDRICRKRKRVLYISGNISCRHQISKYIYFSIGTITARLRLLKYCQFHQCHARKVLFACVKVYFLRYKELAKF